MVQQLTELVEQVCTFQRKQRGKTEGGVRTYRWNLEQFLVFIRNRHGRLTRVTDVAPVVIQAWMDDMAGADLALSTMRVRQSSLSSFCAWLVNRAQVPGTAIMDALVERQRRGSGRVT